MPPLRYESDYSEREYAHNYAAGDDTEQNCKGGLPYPKLQKSCDERSAPCARSGKGNRNKKQKPEELDIIDGFGFFVAVVDYFLEYPSDFIDL